MIVDGSYVISDEGEISAVVGQGIAYYLGIGLNFLNPINIYVIRRSARISMKWVGWAQLIM